MSLYDKLIDESSKWIGVHEKGTNSGPEVQMFQRYVDGKALQESWCLCFLQYCLGQIETREKIRTKVFKTEHVMTLWNKTPPELRSPRPKEGCIVVWNYVGTPSGHCGIISKVHPTKIETIEANTSKGSEVEREGDGIYKKERSLNPRGKMKIVGFLDPFCILLKGSPADTQTQTVA